MGWFSRSKEKQESQAPAADAEAAPETAAAAEQPDQSDESQQQGWFARFQQGLKRTTQVLNTDIRDLFKKEGRLVDDDFLRELFAVLVKTDMGFAANSASS